MTNNAFDFRSDTVTHPTQGMRDAMANAEVGDDVFGEDPSVIRLQEEIAQRLGKEAAIYVPSGTMSNLIGVRLHCKPGDEMICEVDCHIYNYEQAGYAQLSGVAVRTVQGTNGLIDPDQLHTLIRPTDVHYVRTSLIALENTHNRGGGRIQPYKTVETICRWAHENGLATHLDGARLMNAVVATGIDAPRWTKHFDTVSVCFSKGLGAPVGSALAGPKSLIDEARRHRKVLGGGMRQAGVIAAAALYALEHHIDRLAEDHANAQRLAEAIRDLERLTLVPDTVDTNLLFFDIDSQWQTAIEFAAQLRERGVLMLPTAGQRIRAVTHLDIDAKAVERAIEALRDVAR